MRNGPLICTYLSTLRISQTTKTWHEMNLQSSFVRSLKMFMGTFWAHIKPQRSVFCSYSMQQHFFSFSDMNQILDSLSDSSMSTENKYWSNRENIKWENCSSPSLRPIEFIQSRNLPSIFYNFSRAWWKSMLWTKAWPGLCTVKLKPTFWWKGL